jgi:hypothetical protein
MNFLDLKTHIITILSCVFLFGGCGHAKKDEVQPQYTNYVVDFDDKNTVLFTIGAPSYLAELAAANPKYFRRIDSKKELLTKEFVFGDFEILFSKGDTLLIPKRK